MRARATRPSGSARCGSGADCSVMRYSSLYTPRWRLAPLRESRTRATPTGGRPATRSRSFSLSLSLTHIHNLSLPLSLTLLISLSLFFALSLSLSLSLSPSLSLSLFHSFSLTLSFSLSCYVLHPVSAALTSCFRIRSCI
jgi:hypothetical protein